MKSDPVTSCRDEDEAAWDQTGGAPGASSADGQRPSNAAVLPRASDGQSDPSGAPPVDLNDLNNARTVAVLSVPPHSRVLDVGSGPGTVARALAARGCRVWALDVDSGATRLASPWCDDVLQGDVETADLDALLGLQRLDAILFLDVLQHLRDPAAAIRRVLPLLAPGGRMILSVPHVAHAAVRLQLAGIFASSAEGFLDRTHLHFFDRSSLHELLRSSGVRVIEEIRVVRTVEETDIPRKPAEFPREVFDLATAGLDAATCQFVVSVVPGAVSPTVERMPTLFSTLMEHLHRAERDGRLLQIRTRDLERQVENGRTEQDRLRQALEEAQEGQRRSAEALTAVSEDFRQSEVKRQQSEEQLARTTAELVACQLDRRFLRDDVLVKDAYLATLRREAALREEAARRQEAALRQEEAARREEAALRQQADADSRGLSERLDDLTARHAAEVMRAANLDLSYREVGQQLERTQRELQRVHASVAETMAQPRYVVADRCNAWARRAGFLHSALKRMWSARYRGR